MEKLFIPKKIRVGYQERKGTYNGKLAYIIYFDAKNKLRKEASWLSWSWLEDKFRDENVYNSETRSHEKNDDGTYKRISVRYEKNLGFNDFDNVPTSGFVLNKGVGGQRESWGWNARNEYIRVFDPRGFEFEISVANLLYILQECTSTRGKGLEGDFVYSWDGKDLLLLPVDTYEYKMSADFTINQGKKVDKSEMKVGATYQFKDMSKAMYLGRKEFYLNDLVKAHIFYNIDTHSFFYTSGFTKIAGLVDEHQPDNYADIVEEWLARPNNNLVKEIRFDNINFDLNEYRGKQFGNYKRKDGTLVSFNLRGTYFAEKGKQDYHYSQLTTQGNHWYHVENDIKIEEIITKSNPRVKDGGIVWSHHNYHYAQNKEVDDRIRKYHDISIDDILTKLYDQFELKVILEDGTELTESSYYSKLALNKV